MLPASSKGDSVDTLPRTTTMLTFIDDGAQLHRGALVDSLVELSAVLSELPQDRAGVRLHHDADLTRFLTPDGVIGGIAASVLGDGCRGVRAVLFDKTATTNWSLGWHQDRTICVRQRIDVPGFGPWTRKAGIDHVEPPFDLLTRMVTLRVHLDDVSADNAPLLIAPGSHRDGRVPVEDVVSVVARRGIHACLAEAGDVWLYATPILHASEAARTPLRRRVLQIDFAAEDLPEGLEWLGLARG